MPLGAWSLKIWVFIIFSSGQIALPHSDPVLLDSQLLIEEQVVDIIRRAFVQPWFVHQMWPYLEPDSLHSVTEALVISHVDYWIHCTWGYPWNPIGSFLIQSAVARAVFGGPRMAHITSLLHKQHWLQVCFQVQFKVLVMTFEVLNGIDPGYLINRLVPLGQW